MARVVKRSLPSVPSPMLERQSIEYQRGFAAGEAAARNHWAALVVDGAVRWLRSKQEILDLAVSLATALVGREVQRDGEWIERQMERLLTRAAALRPLLFLVHPDDLPAAQRLLEPLATLAPLRVQADATLVCGDCVLRCATGELDGRLATQLAAFRQALATLELRDELIEPTATERA